MPGLEKIGIEAVVEGFGKFQSDLQAMGASYDRTTSRFSAGLGAISAGAGGIGVAVGAAIAVVKGLEKAFEGVLSIIKQVTTAVAGFVTEGMMLAGRFQEMEFAALAIGRAMGFQEEEIRGAIDALNEAGIRYDEAAKGVGSLLQAQVDLTKAQELASIAQAAGIRLGEDSSETFGRLIHAITTGSTVMLRRMGIMVDNEAAERAYAASVGMSVDAMTQQQKVAARTNAIIEQSAIVMDVYAAAMESPTKALRSLVGRVLPEMKAAFGQFFLPAWKEAIDAVSGFAKAMTAAMREGGALYPVLVKLGAIAKILMEAFSSALNVITNFVSDMGTELNTGIGQIVEDMFFWGAEIVLALAEGMVSAMAGALTWAMNALTSMLTGWLMGASPPKVAPNIGKWGAATVGEWLKGFTEGDFSVLEKIQKPLKQVLSGPAFAALSGDLIKALSAGGKPGEGFFEQIAASSKIFGKEVAQLARLQFKLADATTKVQEAEERLKVAREGVSTAQATISKLTREHNRMLREGATEAELEAKREEIGVAEENLVLAKEQVMEAELGEQEAQKQLGTLQEQVTLQDKLIQQLIALTKSQADVAASTERAAAKMRDLKGAAGELAHELSGVAAPAAFEISAAISNAVNKMTKKLKVRAWASGLIGQFLRIKVQVVLLAKRIQTFAEFVVEKWDEIKEGVSPTVDDMVLWFSEAIPVAMRLLRFGAKLTWTLMKIWSAWVTMILIPTLRRVVTDALNFIRNALVDQKTAWENLGLIWKEAVRYLREELIPFFEDVFAAAITRFKDRVIQPLIDIFATLFEKMQGVAEFLTMIIGLVGEAQDALNRLPGDGGDGGQPQQRGGYRTRGAMSPAFAGAGMGAAAPQQVMNAPITIGPNYISSGMDEVALEMMVENVLKRVLRR